MKYPIARALALCLAAFALLASGVAFADTAPPMNPDAPQSLAALWPMLAVGVASLVGYLVPKLSAEFTFFHGGTGKATLTVIGAFVSSVPSAIQAHGLCWAMLAWAALGAVSTLTSTLDPKPKATALLLPIVFLLGAGAISGCATIYTPPGATTAQKLKDDLSAIGIVEADVKAQCGAQFAPLGAQAMAILSIAEAAGDVAAYNIAGAVQAAGVALPVVAGDAKGMVCVAKVIQADYQKLKPKAAPPAVATAQ